MGMNTGEIRSLYKVMILVLYLWKLCCGIAVPGGPPTPEPMTLDSEAIAAAK